MFINNVFHLAGFDLKPFADLVQTVQRLCLYRQKKKKN